MHRSFAQLCAALIIALGWMPSVQGQTLPNAVSTPFLVDNFTDLAWLYRTSFSTEHLNNIRLCDQFSGADAGAKLQACIADLPSTGGVADARGFQGLQTVGSTVTVNKPVHLMLCDSTLATSAPQLFNVTSASVTITGCASKSTTLITSSNTGDIIQTNSVDTTIRDLGFRCTGGARSSGAAVHLATGANGQSDNLFIEPCYNDVQMDGGTSWNWGPMKMFPTASTPREAVCNAHIFMRGGSAGVPTITDTTFVHPIISVDRACTLASVYLDYSSDSITFFSLETVTTGTCRTTACQPGILLTNTNTGSSPSPRTIRFFGGIVESGTADTGVQSDSCKDCLFEGSNIDNALIGLQVNETASAGLNGNFRFVNGRIIQTVQECVKIIGSNGVFIQGNRLGGCAQVAGGFDAIKVNSDVLKFHVDNNFFEPSFSYSFFPNYFVHVSAGGGDQFTISYNQMLNANRVTGDILDSSTGLNKIIGPNN